LISKEGATIYSLQEPDKKMSKTGDPKGCIGIFDKSEDIKKKVMSAQTDSENEIRFDLTKKKGISNLLNIYSLFSKKSIKDIEKEFEGKGYGEFKKSLTELLIDKLKVIQENRMEKEDVKKILEKGKKLAEARAEEKMKVVRKKMGLAL
jgi:tryptophanyl-tRNA synthetase